MIARILIILGILLPALAAAEARVALVIGNDDYDAVPRLEKAANDARAMAAALRDLDFDVIEALNVSRRDMNRALADFTGRVGPGDVAMVFYAGHAIEIEGQNYLLPTDIPDAQPGQEGFVRAEAIALNSVLQRMGGTGARLTITVLDSCRDNPFGSAGRSVGGTRGLSRVDPPQGSFILYSAGPGQTALDRLNDGDPHPNSVFTRTLLPLMRTPGLNLVQMAQKVRGEVEDLAWTVRHKQRPAYSDDLDDPFTFAAAPKPTQVSMNDPNRPAPPPADDRAGLEKALWDALGDNPSAADYEAFLQSFPNGVFAPLARARLNALQSAGAEEDSDRGGRTSTGAAGRPTGGRSDDAAARAAYVGAFPGLWHGVGEGCGLKKGTWEFSEAMIRGNASLFDITGVRPAPRGADAVLVDVTKQGSGERMTFEIRARGRDALTVLGPGFGTDLERCVADGGLGSLEERIDAFKREARGPSFDCGKATKTDEFLICASPRLSALDRLLSEDYGKLRRSSTLSAADKDRLRDQQRAWLRDRRSCNVEPCVEAATMRRIRELQSY